MDARITDPVLHVLGALIAGLQAWQDTFPKCETAEDLEPLRGSKGTVTLQRQHRLTVGQELPAGEFWGSVGQVWSGQTVLFKNGSRFDGMSEQAVRLAKAKGKAGNVAKGLTLEERKALAESILSAE